MRLLQADEIFRTERRFNAYNACNLQKFRAIHKLLVDNSSKNKDNKNIKATYLIRTMIIGE